MATNTGAMVLRRSQIPFLGAFALVAVTALSSFAAAPRNAANLFVIQRSKNAGEVHYDARTTKEGTLDAKDAVDGYWMNDLPNDQWGRSELSWIQKRAYGWDTRPEKDGTAFLKLRAFPDRNMWIVKNKGRWRVFTTIASKQAYMDRLYVATDESGVLPKVLYVDVFGVDAASGAALTEHIVP